MRSIRWAAAAGLGAALAAAAAAANHVPLALNEVGLARADRGGWSQAAEFVSLILDTGWAFAAVAVVAGRLVSAGRPVWVGAAGGFVALTTATLVYDLAEWWLVGQPMTFGFWLIACFVLGPALGVVGAIIRRPGPAGVLAALVVPVGAALNMVVVPPAADSLMAMPVRVTVWAAAAAAVVIVLVRGVPGRGPGSPAPATR